MAQNLLLDHEADLPVSVRQREMQGKESLLEREASRLPADIKEKMAGQSSRECGPVYKFPTCRRTLLQETALG